MGRRAVGKLLTQKKQKTRQILAVLEQTYPQAKMALNYSNPWELLVAVVLSAQCTDKRVNQVTKTLFPEAQNAKLKAKNSNLKLATKTSAAREIMYFAEAPLADIEREIKSTGFYKNKAKNLKATAQIILQKYNGEIPRTMDELTTLPGVARKTANIILGNAFGIVEGIAVDTHVARISQRLRLVDLERIGKGKERKFTRKGKQLVDFKTGVNTDKIEQQLMQVVPKKDWFKFTYLLIEHGRAVCQARKPLCSSCPLATLCPVTRIRRAALQED